MSEPRAAEYMPPLDFASDVLNVNLWYKQREVLDALPDHRRVAVKSGNGLGKGYSAAVAVLWFLHCHDPGIVLSTAPTFRQVRHILWRQIRRLYRPAREQLGGKMLDTRWEIAEDRYAMGLSAESADEFQGFHSPNMFIVVDEAEGVSDEIYEAIDAVMTSAEPRLLLIGNPTTTSGAFRRAFYEERHLYHTITNSALDSPNVKAGKIETKGLTTSQWVQERKDTWGEENPIYRARVLGEFPDQAEDTLTLMLQAIAGHDPLDPSTVPVPVPDFSGSLGKGLRGLKMGIPSNYYFDLLDSEVEAAVRKAINALVELGVEAQEVSIPSMKYAGALRIAGLVDGIVVHEPYIKKARQDYGLPVLYRTLAGQFVLGRDYAKALTAQRIIKEDYARVLQDVDFLVTPSSPIAAWRIDSETVTIGGSEYPVRGPGGGMTSRFTSPSNATGLPAISVPCGFTQGGLPIGFQLIARAFEEQVLFQVADGYEAVSPSRNRRPAIVDAP